MAYNTFEQQDQQEMTYSPQIPQQQQQAQQVQQPVKQQQPVKEQPQLHVTKEQFNDYAPINQGQGQGQMMQTAQQAMYTRQGYGSNDGNKGYNNGPSYFDRLIAKRTDIARLFVLALIVVLGLSMHTMVTHYLDKYIDKSFMTQSMELMVRLSYPLFILVVIWLLKAL